MDTSQRLRNRMVKEQMIRRGITDSTLIEALRKVPRHEFVPPEEVDRAYEDCPLPIGEGQTISQPYMAALMTECLQLNKRKTVLEVGTGSGYQTAILAELSALVCTVERIKSLAERAEKILEKLRYTNIVFHVGDGSRGWPAPNERFDAVIVTAAASCRPGHLLEQLKEDGRLVIPIGERLGQTLMLFVKKKGKITEEEICGCVFVPLIGEGLSK